MPQSDIAFATEFLLASLADGPRCAADVLRESRIYDIPTQSLMDAAGDLGMYVWQEWRTIIWGFEGAPTVCLRHKRATDV
jgi:hypothetical protein